MERQTKTTKTKWRKVKQTQSFSLYHHTEKESLWQVRSRNSDVYTRRRILADSLEEALAEAETVLSASPPPEKPVSVRFPSAARRAVIPQPTSITIADAFAMTLDESEKKPSTREYWLHYAEAFLHWLSENHPEINYWDELNRRIVRQYIATFKGKAPNSIRIYTQPIRQTSAHLSRELDYHDFAKGLASQTKLTKTPPVVDIHDVGAFLDWLAKNFVCIEGGVALQGLAGLQLQEATRLTWDKVDLKQGLIEISGEVKNPYRERLIPVCSRVLEALMRTKEFQLRIVERARKRAAKRGEFTDIPEPNLVIIGERGRPYTDYRHYSHAIRTCLKAWNPRIGWAPKDLRNCLPTFATLNGIHNSLWEQYIGHAPTTVTGRHYVPRLTACSSGEAAFNEKAICLFREQVVRRIEEEVDA